MADVDGDGAYELIVKWDPSNSKDVSQLGYAGEVFIDAYEFDGTLLNRISLGKNIRPARTTRNSSRTTSTGRPQRADAQDRTGNEVHDVRRRRLR